MERPPTPSIPRDARAQFGFKMKQHKPTHVVFIAGSHVIGTTHLAESVSQALDCPWLDGSEICKFAEASANAISGPGTESTEQWQTIFRRNAVARMNRMGIVVQDGCREAYELEEENEREQQEQPAASSKPILLILTFPALKKWNRVALSNKLEMAEGKQPLSVFFILLLISKELLGHRFLGAETEELAKENFQYKMERNSAPDADETNVSVVNAESSVEDQVSQVLQLVRDRFALD